MHDPSSIIRTLTAAAGALDAQGHAGLADELTALAQEALDDFTVPRGVGPEFEVGEAAYMDEEALKEKDALSSHIDRLNLMHELAEQMGNIVGFSVEDYNPRSNFGSQEFLRLSDVVAKMYEAIKPSAS